MSGLVELTAVENEVEAEMVSSLLASHGIQTVIKAAPLEFPMSALLRVVYVLDEDLERALELLDSSNFVADDEDDED
ncbi:MAG: DUF2007 domain-containing protein [Actinomycetota bacterium]|nr:DUF2007 domain-containing protein [Actinomycetota bacterium]